MKLFQSSQDRDFELLSAFLDDELSPAERVKLERRLQADPQLRSTLNGLRRVQTRLNTLPRLKVPRSFTLKPGMVGQQRQQPSSLLPVLNYATVLAATLFAVLIGADLALGSRPLAVPEAQQPQVALAPYDANATSLESVQLTPEASPKLGGESETPATDTQAFTFGTESATEPLTGNGGQGGGGSGGGGDGTGVGGGGVGNTSNPPAVTDSTSQTTTADLYGETPTPDGTLRIFADTGTPTAPSPAPVESAPDTTDVTTGERQATTEPFTPIRIGIALAGLAFLLLIGVSIFLRRR